MSRFVTPSMSSSAVQFKSSNAILCMTLSMSSNATLYRSSSAIQSMIRSVTAPSQLMEDLEVDLGAQVVVALVLSLDTVLLNHLRADKSPGKSVEMFLDNSATMYQGKLLGRNVRMFPDRNVEMFLAQRRHSQLGCMLLYVP